MAKIISEFAKEEVAVLLSSPHLHGKAFETGVVDLFYGDHKMYEVDPNGWLTPWAITTINPSRRPIWIGKRLARQLIAKYLQERT